MEERAGERFLKRDYAFRQAWSEPASYASELYTHYRRLGLGGDTSMSEIVLPMYYLLSLGFGSHVAIKLTEDHVRSGLQELFIVWFEDHDPEMRKWYRTGVEGQHILSGGTDETGLDGAGRPPEDFARLANGYSRIGVGGGVSLSHLVLAAFALLAKEADQDELLEIAMASVRRHLEILALQWQEVLDMDSSMTNRMKAQALLKSTGSHDSPDWDGPERGKWGPEEPEGFRSGEGGQADGHDGCAGENSKS